MQNAKQEMKNAKRRRSSGFSILHFAFPDLHFAFPLFRVFVPSWVNPFLGARFDAPAEVFYTARPNRWSKLLWHFNA
jgi:hypothetical protein